MPEPTDAERLAQIRKRLDAATPGPWLEVSDLPMYAIAGPGRYRVVATPNQNSHRYARAGEAIDTGIGNAMDAAFIAAAPEDIAYLLDLVERQARQIAAVEAAWPCANCGQTQADCICGSHCPPLKPGWLDAAITGMESRQEHIARDIREGRFPQRSERQLRAASGAPAALKGTQ